MTSLTLKLRPETGCKRLPLPPQHLFHHITTNIGPEFEMLILRNTTFFTHNLLDATAVHDLLLSVNELYIPEQLA
jgi:hypothetical protein